MRKTALVALLGTMLGLTPGLAHAGHWRPYHPRFVAVRHFHAPGALIGLGIAGAVLGTVAIVDSIVRPRPVYVVAPPPPPPSPYEEAYRQGYEEGRRTSNYDY